MLTQDDVIYFVVTDRFYDGDPENNQGVNKANPKAFHGGDFAGLTAKIPYLQTLGVTALGITPVYLNITDFGDSAGYHGYWPIDFERVDPHLYSKKTDLWEDGKAYLKKLVDAFHHAGIKVILDMVAHTGYHTPKYLAYPKKNFELHNFNVHDKADVDDYFVQNITNWIDETGIDGIRMDTIKHVDPAFRYFFKSCIKTKNPQVTLVGDVLDWNPSSASRYQQEYGFDTLFDFPLCHAIKSTVIWDQPMTKLARPRLKQDEQKGILDLDEPYMNANRLITLLDNHDSNRRIMTEILDRVGNQDRDLARKILKLCLSLLFTTRGIPQIYYGTEIGMEGKADPDNRRDMVWSVFDESNKPTDDHPFERDIFEHLVKMIELRRRNDAIRYGYLFTLYVDRFIYAYLREFRGNVVLVVINNSHEAMPSPISIKITAICSISSRIKNVLADGVIINSQFDEIPDVTMQKGCVDVKLPGKTAGIYILKS